MSTRVGRVALRVAVILLYRDRVASGTQAVTVTTNSDHRNQQAHHQTSLFLPHRKVDQTFMKVENLKPERLFQE